jgi:hypothetical protein
MQKLELIRVPYKEKIGDHCKELEPNVVEDTLFLENGKVVGFYIKNIRIKYQTAAKFADVANNEFISTRVPKSTMKRSSGLFDKDNEVLQYSTIIGSVPPKPHMRRNYPTASSVHLAPSAEIFIKAMRGLCREAEEIIKEIDEEMFLNQKKIISEGVPERWRFGRLFTSSISNANISAAFHTDNANLKGCVNVIISKKKMAEGGHLHIPEYGATIESCDNSMVVYPAWKSMHGVTPIKCKSSFGYRNSLVFYPLAAFKKYD